MHARQVAGVGELPGQADRGVQAVLELVDQPPADRRGVRRGGAGGRRSRGLPVVRSSASGRGRPAPSRTRGRWASVTPQAASVARGARVVGQRLDDGDQGLRLQEGELPVAEVVDQRAEGLGPQRDRAGAPPGPGRVERRPRQGTPPWSHERSRLSRRRTCRRWRPLRRATPRPAPPRRPGAGAVSTSVGGLGHGALLVIAVTDGCREANDTGCHAATRGCLDPPARRRGTGMMRRVTATRPPRPASRPRGPAPGWSGPPWTCSRCAASSRSPSTRSPTPRASAAAPSSATSPTKADAVWGDFAAHVARLEGLLADADPAQPVLASVCAAYVEVNDYASGRPAAAARSGCG